MMMDSHEHRLEAAARALREQLPELEASLDDAVMSAIKSEQRRKAAPAAPRSGRWGWLVEPRHVQVRPIWVGAGLAAAAALAIWLVPARRGAGEAPAAAAAGADTVFVHFSLAAPAAREVSLAGTFNGWEAGQLSLRRNADGTWEATIPLPVGEHRYQFVVDGQRWLPDPSAQSQVDDGFGGTNSVIVVGPKGVVRS